MRFMMLMIPKGYDRAAPDTMPDAKAVEEMMKYNKSLQDAGVLLSLEGLHPPATGARVTFKKGKSRVTNGPFADTKETLGGFLDDPGEFDGRCDQMGYALPGLGQ